MAKSFYHLRKKQEFASEELEKIKQEIHILKLIENRERNFAYSNIELAQGYEFALKDIASVIDKHIAELRRW